MKLIWEPLYGTTFLRNLQIAQLHADVYGSVMEIKINKIHFVYGETLNGLYSLSYMSRLMRVIFKELKDLKWEVYCCIRN